MKECVNSDFDDVTIFVAFGEIKNEKLEEE
jgi:hypothetical protein